MFEQDDAVLKSVVDELRRPVRVDPALDARVMSAIESESRESVFGRARPWLTEPKVVTMTPLRAMALAAGIVAIAAVGVNQTAGTKKAAVEPLAATSAPRTDTTVIQFVFVAPTAHSVSLVGDFNGWDRTQTPLQAGQSAGMWSVALPLPPGRHRYAFIVDGTKWVVDPGAPRAVEDDFGSPNSVVTVGEQTT